MNIYRNITLEWDRGKGPSFGFTYGDFTGDSIVGKRGIKLYKTLLIFKHAKERPSIEFFIHLF